jgi:hypothetical protein
MAGGDAMNTPPGGRYRVAAMFDGEARMIGATDDQTEANRMGLAALHAGAAHFRVMDTTPDADRPMPVTDQERENMQALLPPAPAGFTASNG